ncbi:MFS transporter [Ralstonia solanacearum]|uniref:MFS transporter n=2 Tax=Ralstonia solanacearum species complex TaxID=3116862 RepID=A0A454TN52_9RALS|nr:MFS transporter [Ralstonia pseudosolanacearum]APC67882.2 MFS transporter [Ralstonia solanacearum OE1-1]AUS43929.1 MFS transporter [Ralstonia solanacearum]API76498.1 MFS transporter [Ralstonia pseudosolanacearum]AYA48192.1 MFS transporter [Ralstonia pseudosolanacearum]MCK4134128.1 MFS transporter [Ralstonia pseudosolanacearum]
MQHTLSSSLSSLPAAHATRTAAWRVAIAGMVALSVAMGIGRFAFTPILPMMLHDGSVTLGQGSWLATLNYLGYFVGALACMALRGDAARLIRIGLVATVLLTAGMGVLQGQPAWLVLRFAAGVVSALVFVFTAGWCLHRLTELGHAALGGIIFCGPGLGIAVPGLVASGMVALGWHASSAWIAFGVLSAVLSAAVWPTVRPERRPHAAASAPGISGAAPGLGLPTVIITLAYGLAGFGYIVTATFLPVIARRVLPAGSIWPDLFWPIFGVGVALGALLSTRISLARDNRTLLAAAYAMQAVAVAASIVWPTVGGLALSSLLLGLPFTAITLFAMREARRLWPHAVPRLMGLMTAVYGIGQIAGPPLANRLFAATGGFDASLAAAAASLVLGMAMFLTVRRIAPAGA